MFRGAGVQSRVGAWRRVLLSVVMWVPRVGMEVDCPTPARAWVQFLGLSKAAQRRGFVGTPSGPLLRVGQGGEQQEERVCSPR